MGELQGLRGGPVWHRLAKGHSIPTLWVTKGSVLSIDRSCCTTVCIYGVPGP